MDTIDSLEASAYTFPTDHPEADGTLAWDSTTMVLVRVCSGTTEGIGWTYGAGQCVGLIRDTLMPLVVGRSAMDVPGAYEAMIRGVRNDGRPGLAGYAISAIDLALWDLKARLLDVPLSSLIGRTYPSVPIYGSGGFTTYNSRELVRQLRDWTVRDQLRRVKIKIGESWGNCEARDHRRMELARQTVGDSVELYVDANGAYQPKQAIRLMRAAADLDVTWFEEPVSSDDTAGLRQVRDAVLADVAAGEYGCRLEYFRHMCEAHAVDCLQADATRCGGVTGWLRAAAVADAFGLQLSGHCSPQAHAHVATAIPNLRHLEWFHDHVRIERKCFDGALEPYNGRLIPDVERPGNGLEIRSSDIEGFRVA